MGSRRVRTIAHAAAALGTVAAVLCLPAGAAAQQSKRPNIVVVTSDDQPYVSFLRRYMPKTIGLADNGKGTTFANAIAATPLCCPSRAALLTGQYGHNNGVLWNNYDRLRAKRQVLPAWLQRVGYRTAHVGKWLNGYESFVRNPYKPAPGWRGWYTQVAPRRYYDYSMSLNGRRSQYGSRKRHHVTTVTTRHARRVASNLASKRAPFYLQVDYFAPHTGRGRRNGEGCRGAPVPRPADKRRYASEPFYQNGDPPSERSFNEADISDKPSSFQRRFDRLSSDKRRRVRNRWRCVLESIRGVDRGLSRIVRAIRRAGELGDTVIVFTSDNGFFHGEHRIPNKKAFPYEENLRVPLMIRIPSGLLEAGPVSRSNGMVANIDLAPTLLELARATPCRHQGSCRTMDGRSLIDLIEGEPDATNLFGQRSLLIEKGRCQYRGVRSVDAVYLQWERMGQNGCAETEAEYYDLDADPRQLENLLPPSGPPGISPGRRQTLALQVAALRECAGIAGRDPSPAPRAYCE